MTSATQEMPVRDVDVRSRESSAGGQLTVDRDSPQPTADGKTYQREAVDSARAAGIALLTSATVVLAALSAVLLLIAR
jgi:hypothetical protein